MQGWEYKIVHRGRGVEEGGNWYVGSPWETRNHHTPDLGTILRELGDEGWELVGISTRANIGSRIGGNVAGMTTDEVLIFKRPKE